MTQTMQAMVEAIESEGYETRVSGDRIYVSLRGRRLGYVTEEDASGRTGTCRYVERAGSISAALRAAAISVS